jgi:hypothetical protein
VEYFVYGREGPGSLAVGALAIFGWYGGQLAPSTLKVWSTKMWWGQLTPM